MTEERPGAAPPGSATALLLLEGAREGRDVEDAVALVPPARDVRRALAVELETGGRVAGAAVFDIDETLLVFFKGEDETVVPADLTPIDVALVKPAAGFEVSG